MSLSIPARLAVSLAVCAPLGAAGQHRTEVARLEAQPASLVVAVGETTPLSIVAFGPDGEPVAASVRIAAPRRGLEFRRGVVRGLRAGDYEIVATVALPGGAVEAPVRVTIPVTVVWPAVTTIEITAATGTLYEGTIIPHHAAAHHRDGSIRPGATFEWSTSDSEVAMVDRFGNVVASGAGRVTIRAAFGEVEGERTYRVRPFPGATMTIEGGEPQVRTGDVQTFATVVRSGRGDVVDDAPITWSFAFEPAPGHIASSGPAQIVDGKMVADVPGLYTVIASSGPLSARKSFEAVPRDVVQRVRVVGHGRQDTHYTSDLWVFEGVDGRDYAFTGARQAQSHAFVWDVTDPSHIVKTDSIRVDARSVNDVKVSPDARYAAMSREGASNRRNGVVILDLKQPGHPTVAATYDEGLTGGVHNVFATDDYLFAVSGGDKYVILDVRDIYHPRYVSEYNHPDSRVHDVWVYDGLAYSAEWETGLVVVDVGNGRWGGTIENPVLGTVITLPSGATHAVFPYRQESSGRFYLFIGDEIVNRRGLAWEGTGPDHRQQYDPETGRGGYPRATSGYVQIVDFTDPENPRMVARYEVSEYGTHNIWVEDDILYQAYYEGGARVIDVSGELMGNLYTQGREIAVFKPLDPIGWIPNAPATWSVIPYKGNIFFSDINSGLWAIRLEPKERPVME